jgi:fibronectin-binding autotransporter adhesin
MRIPMRRVAAMRAARRLDSACHRAIDTSRRRLAIILPIGAGAMLLAQSALAQSLITNTADSYYYANFSPTDAPAGTNGSTYSDKSDYTDWTNSIPSGLTASKFVLGIQSTSSGSFPSLITAPNGNSSASAEGGVYATTSSSNMGVYLGTGTGVAQTDTGSNFNGTASLFTVSFNSEWSLSSPYTAGSVNYQFPVGGQVGAGGRDVVNISNLTFVSNGSTLDVIPSLSANFTNSGNSPAYPTTLLSGLVVLGTVPAGTFQIAGTVSFTARNDLTPSFFFAPAFLPQLGALLTNETYTGASSGSWGTASNWSGNIVPGTGSVNTAIFGGSSAGLVNLNGNQSISVIDFTNTSGYTISPGTSGFLTLQTNSGGTASIITQTGDDVIQPAVVLNSPNTQLAAYNPGSFLQLDGGISNAAGVTAGITISGEGTVDLTGTSTYTGPTTIAGGDLQLGNLRSVGVLASSPIVDNGQLTFAEIGTVNVSNPISGGGSVAVDQNGVLLLSGANSYTGTTAINFGILRLGNTAALGDSFVQINGGELDLNGLNTTISGLSGTGTLDNTNTTFDSILTVSGATSSTFSGIIQNSGALVYLTKSGLGTLDLNNDQTFGGITSINAGTLALDFTGVSSSFDLLESPGIQMSGGTLAIVGANSGEIIQQFAETTLFNGPSTITTANEATSTEVVLGTLTRTASQQGAILQLIPSTPGGTFTPYAIATSTPDSIVAATNDNLAFSDYATFGMYDWAATNNLIVSDAHTLKEAPVTAGSNISGFYTGPQPATFGLTFPGATVTKEAIVQVNADVNLPGLIEINGTTTLTSVRFNTPNGGLSATNGNTMDQLVINGSAGVLYGGGYLVTPNVGPNNVLITDTSATSTQTRDLSGGATSAGTQDLVIWQNNTAGLLILNTGINDNANLGSGGNGLTKAGPGILVLNATSVYSGATNIEGGSVEIPFNAALGGFGDNDQFGGLQLNGGTLVAVTSLSLGGVNPAGAQANRNITIGQYGGGVVAATGQTLTISGSISDSSNGTARLSFGSIGSFATAQVLSASSNQLTTGMTGGNGTVVMLGSLSNFSGQIVLANGTLQVGNGTSGGSLGANLGVITDDGNLVFDLPAGLGYNLISPLEGIGNLETLGGGSLTLSGLNIYQGLTTIGAGSTLVLNGVGSLPSAGGIYNNTSGGLVQTPTGGVVDNGTLMLTNGDFVLDNAFSGDGAIGIGAGATLALTGNNSGFAGQIKLAGGTMLVTNLNDLPTGTLSDTGSILFELTNPPGGGAVNQTITGSGSIVQNGAVTTVTLTGTNTYAGTTTVEAGTLSISSDANLGADPSSATPGNLVIDGGATLAATSTFALNSNRGISITNGGTAGAIAAFIDVAPGTTLTYDGVISDGGTSAGLTKLNMGTLVLGDAESYSGNTTIGNGTLQLNFAQSGSPASNILEPATTLVLGGYSPDSLATTSFSELNLLGRLSGGASQSFSATQFLAGASVVEVASQLGGSATLNLGALQPAGGAVATFEAPSSGAISATVALTNGIIGGWATTTGGLSLDGIVEGTDWATTSGGAIVPFTSFLVVTNSSTLNKVVTSTSNIQINGTNTADIVADIDNADSTTNLNSIEYINVPGTGGTVSIGSGNTLRLGQVGGILKPGTSTNTIYIGGTSAGGAQSGNGSIGSQNIGTLTAGGASIGLPGTIYLVADSSDEVTPVMIIEAAITNNGGFAGAVTLVKSGPGLVKIDGTNSYSGGTFIDQGEIDLAGTDVGYDNPAGLGTGPVTIEAGADLNLYGAGVGTAVTNSFFIAGGGTVAEPNGAIQLGTNNENTLSGTITLIGPARIGGGANGTGGTSIGSASTISGQITGNFSLDLGSPNEASDIALSNPNNNWTGNTTIDGETGSAAGNTAVHLSQNNVIPNGPGFGDVYIGIIGDTAGAEVLDLDGTNQTINGLFSPSPTTANFTASNTFVENDFSGTTSTLTLGNDNLNAAFYGILRDNNGSGGLLAINKIGLGTQIFGGVNTYSGGTTLTAGELQLAPGATLGSASAPLTLDGGTLDLNGNNLSIGMLSGTDGAVTSSSGLAVLTLNQTTAGSYSGNITGNVELVLGSVFGFGGGGTMTLSGQNSYAGPTVVSSGELVIANPGALPTGSPVSNRGMLVIAANSNPGPLSNSGSVIVNTGTELSVNGAFTQTGGQTAINGTLQVVGGPFNIQSGSLYINPSTGLLDLTNSEMLLNYAGGPSPIQQIQSALTAGYNGGLWNGTDIVSSTVAALNASQSELVYSLGYADGADGLTSVPSGEIEILPTLAGDAKLQGDVVFGDFQVLAQYFGHSGATWDEGAFTYNGVVNFGDFQLLAQDFGSSNAALTAAEVASINQFAGQFGIAVEPNADGVGLTLVSVPEPASTGLLAAAGFGLLARRRRRK